MVPELLCEPCGGRFGVFVVVSTAAMSGGLLAEDEADGVADGLAEAATFTPFTSTVAPVPSTLTETDDDEPAGPAAATVVWNFENAVTAPPPKTKQPTIMATSETAFDCDFGGNACGVEAVSGLCVANDACAGDAFGIDPRIGTPPYGVGIGA